MAQPVTFTDTGPGLTDSSTPNGSPDTSTVRQPSSGLGPPAESMANTHTSCGPEPIGRRSVENPCAAPQPR